MGEKGFLVDAVAEGSVWREAVTHFLESHYKRFTKPEGKASDRFLTPDLLPVLTTHRRSHCNALTLRSSQSAASEESLEEPGKETMLVPVIDISPFVSETSSSKAARDAVVAQVADACRHVGFLVIINHGVASETIAQAFEAAKEYFDQPSEVKKAVSMTPEYPYGYESAEILSKSKDADDKAVLPDLKETFQVCVGPDGREPNVPAQWPEGPPGFKDTMICYYRNVEKLAAVMMKIFAHALELPGDFFDKKIDNHMSSLRILNYPHQEQEPGAEQIRASAHTDYGSLTILAVDDAPGGLQVRDLQGEWHRVQAPAGSYVVNLGDLMQHWTNDQWRSTMHRVVNPPSGCANNRRQSIAFFHNINADTSVECIPTCQSPESPAKYPPVLAGEYLMMKHRAAMGN